MATNSKKLRKVLKTIAKHMVLKYSIKVVEARQNGGDVTAAIQTLIRVKRTFKNR